MGTLGRCNGSCNTLDDLSSRICCLNKTKNVNLNAFNMITEIGESKLLINCFIISCNCRCTSDGRKYDAKQKCSNDRFQCE